MWDSSRGDVRAARPGDLDADAARVVRSSSRLRSKIAEVARQGWGSKPLLQRPWWVSATGAASAAVLSSTPPGLRVMQFNMLAEGLSANPAAIPPFAAGLSGERAEPSSFGGFDAVPYAEHVFDFAGWRRWRLLEEIFARDPDVLAVEEIDHFEDFFLPALTSAGYQGVFVPKADAPGCRFGCIPPPLPSPPPPTPPRASLRGALPPRAFPPLPRLDHPASLWGSLHQVPQRRRGHVLA